MTSDRSPVAASRRGKGNDSTRISGSYHQLAFEATAEAIVADADHALFGQLQLRRPRGARRGDTRHLQDLPLGEADAAEFDRQASSRLPNTTRNTLGRSCRSPIARVM